MAAQQSFFEIIHPGIDINLIGKQRYWIAVAATAAAAVAAAVIGVIAVAVAVAARATARDGAGLARQRRGGALEERGVEAARHMASRRRARAA